jgi:hypothetical protein
MGILVTKKDREGSTNCSVSRLLHSQNIRTKRGEGGCGQEVVHGHGCDYVGECISR